MADLTRFYFLRNTILYRPLRALNHRYILRKWRRRGSTFPPPALFKQKLVQEYGRKYSLQTLVETGTAKGKMVQTCEAHFHRIISIEYDPGLHQQAKIKFANQPHITLLEGDSGELRLDPVSQR